MNDLASAKLIDLQWLSLACRIKSNLSIAFKVFWDLPQPALPESLPYLRQTSVHLPVKRDASGLLPPPLILLKLFCF